MKGNDKHTTLYLVMLLASIFCMPQCLFGYDNILTHPHIVKEAFKVWPNNTSHEIYEYLGMNYLDTSTGVMACGDAQTGELIAEGSKEEDDYDPYLKVCNDDLLLGYGFWHHFYNDTTHTGLNFSSNSSLAYANTYYEKAKHLYFEGKKGQAYWYLGRIAHLIADTTVPAHVKDSAHGLYPCAGLLGLESYESFMEINFDKYSADRVTDFGTIPIFLSLNEIFSKLAVQAATYPSDDKDGTDSSRDSWNNNSVFCGISPIPDPDPPHLFGLLYDRFISDENLDIIASDMVPRAIKYTAALYRSFYDEVNPSGGKIPDTGQTTSYTNTFGEDSDYTINPPSYTKLDSTGASLPSTDTVWAMTKDNVTGLIWENKTDDGGIHDKDNKYTWYDPNPATNGGNAGTPGNGTDTQDFIDALNAAKFGGFNDWRLPTVNELSWLVHSDRSGPSINTGYFKNTMGAFYWSSSTDARYPSRSWGVNFGSGDISNSYISHGHKSDKEYVRAVRGEHPKPLLIDNDNGTVTDPNTGLMWQQGEPGKMSWIAALVYCENLELAGYTDWRLPNKNELQSIIDYTSYDPAIYQTVFINGKSSYYWSSTSIYSDALDGGWRVGFYDGRVESYGVKEYSAYVRAVRTVSQPAAPCTYSISPSSGSFTAGGGTSSVSVTASSSSCTWTASESLSWVSLSPTSGTGNGTFTVTVSANTGAVRSGSVTIAGKPYTINQAAPPTDMVREFVSRFYQVVLGRLADTAGLDFWANSLKNGTKTGADVARAFILSQEFKNQQLDNASYVNVLYSAFFDRNADPGGYSYWLGFLNAGIGRESVLNGFISSQEFFNLCESYSIIPVTCTYSISSSSGSFTSSGGTSSVSVTASNSSCSWTTSESLSWVSLSPNSGTGSGSVTITVAASTGVARSGSVTIAGKPYTINQAAPPTDMVREFVSRFYQVVLGRPADTAGLDFWANSLKNGTKTGADVARGFILSQEFINQQLDNASYVNVLYSTFFDRNADPGGYSYWLGFLNAGIGREAVLNGFISSQEFFNLCESYSIIPVTCTYSISSSSGSFTSSGGTSTVLVTASRSNCYWTASESLDWVSLSQPTSGTGNGSVTITATANTGSARSGLVTVAGKAYTISQLPSGTCGAYVAPGVWKQFDCYNLAAIGKTTNADLFTPSWRLIGGYWQWGRKGPDPSQWHNTNTPNFAHGPTGSDAGSANSGSISGWSQTDAPNGSWSDASKTANDPCPAGYRVPTRSQWDGVRNNNTQSSVGTWSTIGYDYTNYSSARFFGNDLMLPAAGYRWWTSGSLYGRGYEGMYQSSTENSGSYAWFLGFISSSASTSYGGRYSGFSVRCVADDSTI